jgi:hypothetical protein
VQVAVQRTQELERIEAIPRRHVLASDAAELVHELTPRMLAPRGRGLLRAWQAYCLLEAVAEHGGFFGLPVGQGKTLISWLLAVMFQSRRSMLIIPAALRDKTIADFASYVGTWREPNPWPRITTREELSVESGQLTLDRLEPDLIIIDECDDLANPKSAASRRIARYLEKHPECVVVCMSGTISRKSIKGYAHLLRWCLRERAPIPRTAGELELWAACLDDFGSRRINNVAPGPLGGTLRDARTWFRERLTQTPGVVIVDEDSAGDVPLTVRVRLAREDATLDAHFATFLRTLENPDGMPVSDPLSRWRFDAQLGTGLYLRFVAPGPPQEWRDARRAVAALVRDATDASQRTARPIDTEAQVLRRFASDPVVVRWLRACEKHGAQFPTEAVWLTDSAIQSALDWLRESDMPGIVWCGITEFASALAVASRLPHYGPEGKDARTGAKLHVADPRSSMVASWHANKKGFNLQAWRRHLIVYPPQSAKYLEQVFGRSHRAGQTEAVTVDMLATSGGTLDAFEAAISEATCVRDRDAMTQKILRAEVVRAIPRITDSNRFRWARRERTKE